jgi:hypothetical protein
VQQLATRQRKTLIHFKTPPWLQPFSALVGASWHSMMGRQSDKGSPPQTVVLPRRGLLNQSASDPG